MLATVFTTAKKGFACSPMRWLKSNSEGLSFPFRVSHYVSRPHLLKVDSVLGKGIDSTYKMANHFSDFAYWWDWWNLNLSVIQNRYMFGNSQADLFGMLKSVTQNFNSNHFDSPGYWWMKDYVCKFRGCKILQGITVWLNEVYRIFF